jgi:hypothetical protein
MRVLSALAAGFLSAILLDLMLTPVTTLYLEAGIRSGHFGRIGLFVGIIFVLLWAGSTWFLYQGARSAAHVWARGGLVGAAEWMALGIGLFIAQFVYSVGRDTGSGVGGLIGGGLSIVMLLVTMFLALISLLVWFIASRLDAEFQATARDQKLVPCPHCAERIQPAAKTCRFCDYELPLP